MQIAGNEQRGFTLLEIMVVAAIISVLAGLAVVLYNGYVERARSAEIVAKYDSMRTRVGVAVAEGAAGSCADFSKKLDQTVLKDPYVTLGYQYLQVAGGYRPLLTVCGMQGALRVKVASAAYDTLSKNGQVEKGALLKDTVVCFSARLTDTERPVCTGPLPVASGNVPPAQPATPITQPVTPTAPVPTVVKVDLMRSISGATSLSAFSGQQRGVPIGTQLVGLYLAGSDVNQLAAAAPAQLPKVTTAYTPVGDAGYQYLDAQGVLRRLMPGMANNLQASLPPGAQNFWNGGIAIFSDGTVARMQKASNGDTSGSEKDYIYFTVLSGVNAKEGMAIVSGTATPGQSVQVRNGGSVLATVRTDAQGNWNFAGPAALAGTGQSLNAVPAPATP